MPRDKDRKRIIRQRMKKTGESYTAARARIISNRHATLPPASRAGRPGLADVAGMRDDALEAKTGRSWAEWVRALDADAAASLAHSDIATLVKRKYGVADWWTQTVTVGYERIKGLRERGQRRSGEYEASKSKTFPVHVDALFAAWRDMEIRRQWLHGVEPVLRRSTAGKGMRLQWPDGTLVVVGFTAKGAAKSAVAVQHTKLRDRAAAERAKAFWAERLEMLASLLAPAGP